MTGELIALISAESLAVSMLEEVSAYIEPRSHVTEPFLAYVFGLCNECQLHFLVNINKNTKAVGSCQRVMGALCHGLVELQ